MPSPHVYVGAASARFLQKVLARYAARRIFLVADAQAYAASGAEREYQALLGSSAAIRFSDFTANPKLSDVRRGIEVFQASGVDAVVAVGGGTAIDVAKLITVLSRAAGLTADVVRGRQAVPERAVPLIAIPTTAGSGSEATHFAVVYRRGKKYSVAHRSLRPDAVIIDPTFTMSCSPYLTAVCGMDALSQAIESYWSINSTVTSQRYAAEAIRLLLGNLPAAVQGRGSVHFHALAVAAHAAGKAINITQTTAPHALSYTLTAQYGIPHGQAVGVYLPAFFLYNSEVTEADAADRRGAAYVRQTMHELNDLLSAKTFRESYNRIHSFMRSIELVTTLSGLGINDPETVDRLAAGVNYERLANNPRRVSENAVRRLLTTLQ